MQSFFIKQFTMVYKALMLIVGCISLVSARSLSPSSNPSYNNDRSLTQSVHRHNNELDKDYLGPFVRFLVAVNATEVPCVATVVTPELQSRQKYNKSEAISVGACDKGPLEFDMEATPGKNVTINLTFHSSVIEDASPPSCQITWDGHYLIPPPPPMVSVSDTQTLPSLLPGCFTMDSREGWHMTYYWFYVLEWRL